MTGQVEFIANERCLKTGGIEFSELAPLIDGAVPACVGAQITTNDSGWTLTWSVGNAQRFVLAIERPVSKKMDSVIPAEAGIEFRGWIRAYAGMTAADPLTLRISLEGVAASVARRRRCRGNAARVGTTRRAG